VCHLISRIQRDSGSEIGDSYEIVLQILSLIGDCMILRIRTFLNLSERKSLSGFCCSMIASHLFETVRS